MTSIKMSIWDNARDSWRRTRNFPYMCWPMYKISMIKPYHPPKMNIRVLYSTIKKQNRY
jgi:hypothetical protein